MRYMGAISLVLAALFGVGLIINSGQANAATSAAPPPVVPPPSGATLTQDESGTWSTSLYLDTASLCGDKFDLVTDAPAKDNSPTGVTYTFDGSATAVCGATAAKHPVTVVALTFPALTQGAIPQTATLVVTPSSAALAAGAVPVEMSLTVRRVLIGFSSLWYTLWFGLAFVFALILLIEGYRVFKDRRSRADFWGTGLYAPSKKWTFGGSWVTNFTALGTALAGVLTAIGTVSGMMPGVDLGRIVLLFAVVGASTLLAPIVFAALTRRAAAPASGTGDVVAARVSIVAASCFTAFGVGAEIGLIGWVVGSNLSAVSWEAHDVVRGVTFVVAGLFLFQAFRSIHEMPEKPQDSATDGGVGSETIPTPRVTSPT